MTRYFHPMEIEPRPDDYPRTEEELADLEVERQIAHNDELAERMAEGHPDVTLIRRDLGRFEDDRDCADAEDRDFGGWCFRD